jgi:hypothetical protein
MTEQSEHDAAAIRSIAVTVGSWQRLYWLIKE